METQKEITHLKSVLYDPAGFILDNFSIEEESEEYNACRFTLNNISIISRTAKITPTKTGQFVTLWKRENNGPIQPFNISDDFDLVVINTHFENQLGQFVFPKHVLKAKEILSTDVKDGKRGFRVYPPWDETTSKQAIATQKWQCKYFIELSSDKRIDSGMAKQFYSKQ